MFLKDNPLDQCNLKFASNKGEFEGYASVFNSIDAVGDTILPGAFAKSAGKRIKMFLNHDHKGIPIGSWSAVDEDDYGLKVSGAINMEHHLGPSIHSAMKRGDLDGLSIGFQMQKGDWDKRDGGRVIKNADLKEISVVTFPCEAKATISTVKMEVLESIKTERELEDWIREELQASNSVARAVLSHAKRVLLREEATRQEQIGAQQIMSHLDSLKATIERKGV